MRNYSDYDDRLRDLAVTFHQHLFIIKSGEFSSLTSPNYFIYIMLVLPEILSIFYIDTLAYAMRDSPFPYLPTMIRSTAVILIFQ
jgi:hypothetical protein